jgi:hypothetical protein
VTELLASAEQLRIWLKLDSIDVARAEQFLTDASSLVRNYCGQLFDFVEDDVVTINGTGTAVMLLPELPVAAVTKVWAPLEGAGGIIGTGDPELAPTDGGTVFVEGIDYEWDEDGIIRRIHPVAIWRRRFRWYEITYDHGFAGTPETIETVVKRVAARGFTNPEGIRQETIGRYSYTNGGESTGLALFAPDMKDLEHFRIKPARPRAGNVAAGS